MCTECSLLQCLIDHMTTSHHVLNKFKVRRRCTVLSPLTWPSTEISDDTEEFAMTGSVDGCCFMPETQFVGDRLHMDTTQILCV